MTPELRAMALEYVYAFMDDLDDRDDVIRWFQDAETPDGYVLDAGDGEPEAVMIAIIANAFAERHRLRDEDEDEDGEE
jgi:hypothetical protein